MKDKESNIENTAKRRRPSLPPKGSLLLAQSHCFPMEVNGLSYSTKKVPSITLLMLATFNPSLLLDQKTLI